MSRDLNVNLQCDDLETDCAPYVKPDYAQLDDKRLCFPEKYDSTIASYDSGFSSVEKSSHLESFRSIDANEPTRELNRNFENLRIKESEKIREEDKGYNSVEEQNYPVAFDVAQLFQQDNDGDSQLHMAIINLLTPIALFIIGKAPNAEWLNMPNNLLQTPLHLAVIMRMPVVVKQLICGGADRNARDYKGDTPLHIASREGYDDIMQILLDPDCQRQDTIAMVGNCYTYPIKQDLEARNYNGQTCLHLAAEGTHLPCIRHLVRNNVNVNAQDGKSGRTALHYAAETGNILLLEFLLQFQKVNIHARTYAGLTPIMLAYGRNFTDIVLRLQRAGGSVEQSRIDDTDSDDEMS